MTRLAQIRKIKALRKRKLELSLARLAESQADENTVKHNIAKNKSERQTLLNTGRKTLEDAIKFAQTGYASPSKIINISVTLSRHTNQLTAKSKELRDLEEKQLDIIHEKKVRQKSYHEAFRELQKLENLESSEQRSFDTHVMLVEEDEMYETTCTMRGIAV